VSHSGRHWAGANAAPAGSEDAGLSAPRAPVFAAPSAWPADTSGCRSDGLEPRSRRSGSITCGTGWIAPGSEPVNGAAFSILPLSATANPKSVAVEAPLGGDAESRGALGEVLLTLGGADGGVSVGEATSFFTAASFAAAEAGSAVGRGVGLGGGAAGGLAVDGPGAFQAIWG